MKTKVVRNAKKFLSPNYFVVGCFPLSTSGKAILETKEGFSN